jgi:hypothetical protein
MIRAAVVRSRENPREKVLRAKHIRFLTEGESPAGGSATFGEKLSWASQGRLPARVDAMGAPALRHSCRGRPSLWHRPEDDQEIPDLAAFESQRQGVNRFSFAGVNGSERLHADPIPFQLLDHRLSDAVERVPARYRGRDWEKHVADSRRELTILKSA